MKKIIFSEKIKCLRLKENLSQSQLSKRIGITRQALSKYELGTSEPNLYTLIKLSEYFNCTIDSLVFDTIQLNSIDLNLDLDYFLNEISSIQKTNNLISDKLSNLKSLINSVDKSTLTSNSQLEEITPIDSINDIINIDNTKEDTENFNEEYAEELVPNITDITSYRKTKSEIIEEDEEEIEYRNIIDRGCIPAGKLRETFADDFGTFKVPENKLSRKKDYYILTISGDSMDKYYPDGEKILVEDTINVNYGDIVIARVNYSATVKKLSRHEEGIELVPLSNNSEHKPQIITDEDFCIKGKVLGLLSEFLD